MERQSYSQGSPIDIAVIATTATDQAIASLARAGAPPQLVERIKRDERDDMTQEAALAIVEANPGNQALAVTIAQRGAMRWLRRESRERRKLARYMERVKNEGGNESSGASGSGENGAHLPTPSPTPPQSLIYDESQHLALQALSRLPADERDAIRAVTMGDQTLAQHAKAQGVSVATVARRVERGLGRLRGDTGGARGRVAESHNPPLPTGLPQNRPSASGDFNGT